MWQFAAAMLLLVGGTGLGFVFARKKRGLLLVIGLPTLLCAAAVLSPRVQQAVQCRMGGRFRSDDVHPPELVGAWVGWDTSYPTPYCRLELGADGTGRCAMWYRRGETGIWRVVRWDVSLDRVEVALEAGERRERMRGEVLDGALSLDYFGSDGPDLVKNWFGPLHLVPERAQAEAREAIGRALDAR